MAVAMGMEAAGIYAREATSLDRYVQIGVASGRLISVSFPRTPDQEAGGDHELLDRIATYLDGEEDSFQDVEVALTLPTDQRTVLVALRGVPYGRSVTVAELAGMTPTLDSDDASDIATVREALGANPTPLVVPDHRISDGPSAAPAAVVDVLRSLEGL